MTTILLGSVGDKKADGKASENIRKDVIKVQMPLSDLVEHHRLMIYPPLKLTAIITKAKYDPTILAIRGYQRHVLRLATDNGRIDPGLKDLKTLNDAADRVRPKSPGAPITDQIMNKLRLLLHSDELSYYMKFHDPNGTNMCILSKLVNYPDVDDSFLDKAGVSKYLEFSGTGTPPPIEPLSLMTELSRKGRPRDNEQTFKHLYEVTSALLDGIIKTGQVDVYTRSVKGGAGAAVAKLEAWMKDQSSNVNSVYHCCQPQLTLPEGFWSHYVK